MGRATAAPAPADVAAAVFPALLGSVGGALHRGFSLLGPEQSIVGALLQANSRSLSRNRLATHPSNKLHMLARDSMVRSELPEADAADPGGGGAERRSDGSQQGGASAAGRSGGGASSRSVLSGDSASSLQGSRDVDRSAPSAFTLLVEQAVQAQSEIVQQRQQAARQQGGRALLRGPSSLHTIQEVNSLELESTARASTLPSDSATLSRDGSADSSAAVVSPHGAAVRWLSMSTSHSGELPSPFGGSSPFASPNDSMSLPGAAEPAAGGQPSSRPMTIPTPGPGAAQRGTAEEALQQPGSRPMDLSHSIVSPFSSSALASGPFPSGSTFSVASLPDSAAAAAAPAPPAGTFPPAKPGQLLQGAAGGASTDGGGGEVGAEEQAADGSRKVRAGAGSKTGLGSLWLAGRHL